MAETPTYFAGDEIRVPARFRHQANITRVDALFSNEAEGGRETVEFWEKRYENPPVYRADKSALVTESTAVLYAEIPADLPAGVYNCVRLTATTGGGKELEFARLPRFTFEVTPEPANAPQLESFELRPKGAVVESW